MKALIVGSGSIYDYEHLKKRFNWADLVIAADGGAQYLLREGLVPHVLLGDFDSLSAESVEKFKNGNRTEILTFPVKKDFTDMELAIDLACERGAKEVSILGATGSRLDHTVCNVYLLYKLLEKGITGFIEDEKNTIYLINKKLTIKKQADRKVSLLPFPPYAKGVTTKGLSYPLTDGTLIFGTSYGISNEFCDDSATITVKDGMLLVFVSKD